MYKLDRTFGKGQTHEGAAKAEKEFWKSKTSSERLRAVMYLNSIAYGFDPENPPRLDRTYGTSRKHEK